MVLQGINFPRLFVGGELSRINEINERLFNFFCYLINNEHVFIPSSKFAVISFPWTCFPGSGSCLKR